MFSSSRFALVILVAGCTSGPVAPHPIDAGEPAADAAPDGGAPPDAAFTCPPGRSACHGSVHYVCGDDGRSRTEEVSCDSACDAQHGCVFCVPGTRRCEGTASMMCDADGSRWLFGRECADWGSSCGDLGYCEDGCAQAEQARSYMGCEYFAAPLAQTPELDWRNFDYRVVVANPSAQIAEVSVYRGHILEARRTVVPGGVVDIALPWIDAVSFAFGPDPWQSSVVEGGTYRVISNHPVIVSQFNPFHYAAGGSYSYTNDASLLLPTHALGTEHVATSYMPFSNDVGMRYPGFVAIVGVSPEPTLVEVDAAGPIAGDSGGRWEDTPAGGRIQLTLRRGEIAQLAAATPPVCTADRPGHRDGFCEEPDYDITGSIVRADRPVAVFSGHSCANVPTSVPACDHLETQLAPVATWGTEFETMPMRDPATAVANLLRIVAARDATRVTIEPAVRGMSEATLDSGEHLDVMIEDAVSIAADAPIQVAQLLLGQNITDPPLDRGDPALTVLVPAEQHRYEYVFVLPTSYTNTADGGLYLLVSREPGVPIELDGEEIEATWTRAGGRELARIPMTGGTHRARARAPFGVIAYGLGGYTSFAYPAGLDLRVLLL